MYLENVSGMKIVKTQKEINEHPLKFVVATTINLIEGRKVQVKKIDKDGNEVISEHSCYDAFIYYKEKPEVSEEMVNDELDVVLPN